MLIGFALQLRGCPYYFAAVLDIELVVLLIGTVYAAVDSNETDTVLRKGDLGVHSHFQIITRNPSHALGYDNTDFALVYKILDITEPFFLCELGKECLLIDDGIAVIFSDCVMSIFSINGG